MSDEPEIKWQADENSVPLCSASTGNDCPWDDGQCMYPLCIEGDSGENMGDMCYPQTVKMATALKAALAWYDAPVNDAERGTLSDAMNRIREAVTP